MISFTRRPAVVRLHVQMRLFARSGSRCASHKLNSRSSSLSTSCGGGSWRMTPCLAAFERRDADNAALDVDHDRGERKHFGDARPHSMPERV
jgi:hypothetical protein